MAERFEDKYEVLGWVGTGETFLERTRTGSDLTYGLTEESGVRSIVSCETSRLYLDKGLH